MKLVRLWPARPREARHRRFRGPDPRPVRASCRTSPARCSPQGASPRSRRPTIEQLPVVPGKPRLGPCVGERRQLHRHRARIIPTTPPKPACRSRRSRSSSTRRRPASAGRTTTPSIPKDSTKLDWEVELGIVIGQRARYLTQGQGARAWSPAISSPTTCPSAFPDRARRAVDQGQGLRDLRADRPVARHQGRDQGPAESRHVARRQRREAPARQHQDHDLRRAGTSSGTARSSSSWSRATSSSPARRPGVGLGMKPEPKFLKAGDVVTLGIDGLGEQRQKVVKFKK